MLTKGVHNIFCVQMDTMLHATVIALLIVAAASERDLSEVKNHVKEKIESDFNEIRKSIDNEMPILYNLIQKSKTHYDQQNNTILNEVKKYTEEIQQYVASLRLSENVTDSISDCLFESESGVLQSFNNVLRKAGNCLMEIQTTLVNEFVKSATSLKDDAKRIASSLRLSLEDRRDHYGHRQGACSDIDCVNVVFNDAYEKYDALFYKRLTLSLEIEHLNPSSAMTDCTDKYTKDLMTYQEFAKTKLSGCMDGETWSLTSSNNNPNYYG